MISTFALFLFGFLSTGTSYASTELSHSEKFKVTITNDQTGESTVSILDPNDKNNNVKINSILSSNQSKVVGYDVFVPIKTPNSSKITPLDDTGGSKNEGGVTARLNVNYDVSTNGEQIKLNKVYGSWTPSSSMYYLTNRTVNAHSGAVHGNNLVNYPTSNTFSYTTGWGYNYFATGQGSPRAWSSAKINISGMTSTYTIKLEITYP
ncbi:hypothetical protein CON38_24890 [Bacillus cereus]|nr:hypothetical protein CON38_24890 [Bacillus cereus]